MTDDDTDTQEMIVNEITIQQVIDGDGDKVLRILIPSLYGEPDPTTLIGLIERAKFHMQVTEFGDLPDGEDEDDD